MYPELEALYLDLHQTPELSLHEEKTAAKLAARLRQLGFDVTERVGGFGVVAVLKNESGPTVLLRADMDGLPVPEKTGLAYASKVTTKDAAGATVPVMHACGHDIHMTSLIGTATLLVKARSRWRGTLLLVAQPAEELVSGAEAMLKDGLFSRFPRPDFALALHDSAMLPAGTVGITPGYALANVDSLDITIHGKGGHGSQPQTAIDPVVIAARTVVALQTIVARETDPRDPAVVTVGSIHGGTKHNIIPDEVKLQLTVRSYKAEVRKRLLLAIKRITRAEALAAGAPQEPTITVTEGTSAVYNDPALAKRISGALTTARVVDAVEASPPVMGAEDFGQLGKAAGAPSLIFWVGGVPRARWAEAKGDIAQLPSLHSPQWAPDKAPTLKTAVASLTVAALEVLGKR